MDALKHRLIPIQIFQNFASIAPGAEGIGRRCK
jgi:hypothetical protein